MRRLKVSRNKPRLPRFSPQAVLSTQPKTNVISTGARDGLIVRCAVERSLYFVFALVVVSIAKALLWVSPGMPCTPSLLQQPLSTGGQCLPPSPKLFHKKSCQATNHLPPSNQTRSIDVAISPSV